MTSETRVRFAPSPTGPLHIGGLRTALYNYLFAKKTGGTFILRIEDTDQSRFIPGAEDYIREALSWCGIEPGEGPGIGGEFSPYRQSERQEIYADYARELVKQGLAYHAFDTVDELEKARKQYAEAKGESFQYNAHTRGAMRNSLTIPAQETRELLASGAAFVIRFKVPEGETIVLNDLIRGEVKIDSAEVDDKVILKSDGLPTYHLANVVDDHLMKITHVIRGEEWLPSAPLHILLYRSFGWENSMPAFAHLPLLLKPDGKGKLSKRDGIRMGFPVFPLQWSDPSTGENLKGFRESGYLPEAFINFLALLGWNPGTEQEIFSIGELIEEFSIERIGKAGAKFDIDKANWFNQQYLKEKSVAYLADRLEESLISNSIQSPRDFNESVAEVMRERITFPDEIFEKGKYFFYKPTSYDDKVISKKWNPETARAIGEYAGELKKQEKISAESAKGTLEAVLELHNMGFGKVMQALRVCITGDAGGPDLMKIIEILGPQECSERIEAAITSLRDQKQ